MDTIKKAVQLVLPVALSIYLAAPKNSTSSTTWLLVQLGGTSGKVAIAIQKQQGTPRIVKKYTFSTVEGPQPFFKELFKAVGGRKIDKIGVACFGPAVVDRESSKFGSLCNLPGVKQKWEYFSVREALAPLSTDFHFDTDVNAPALAEFRLGGHKALNSLCYITVGTGIGIGLVCGGRTVKGFTHPQGGHISVQRHPEDASFQGVCIYHKSCIEGMASSHAIAKRVGKSVEQLADLGSQDPVWQVVSYYLASLCLSIFLVANPEVIVLGGGVLGRTVLYEQVRAWFGKLNNGYVLHSRLEHMQSFIVPPALLNDSALLGASMLD